jgi:hypothetical protein
MKKLIFTLTIVLCCVFAAQSQSEYKSAIGLRFGVPTSISFKTFISAPGAVEIFAGTRGNKVSGFGWRWFNVGGLYQHHSAISDIEGLKWYVGGGASAYFWSYDDGFGGAGADYSSTSFGLLGTLGLDYKFADYPINLSVDWVPVFFVGDGYSTGFNGGYGALSARYTFR